VPKVLKVHKVPECHGHAPLSCPGFMEAHFAWARCQF